jgi:SAM-dependent methyltransferase
MDQSGGDWFESEAFWTEMFPFMFPEASFAAAAQSVPKLAALAGISSGSVLDLACGPGRHAIPLAQAGYSVTGVDRTRFLLNKARELAAHRGVQVQWIEQDMRYFVRPAAFDLILNLFTSFGYFDDEADNRHVLENIHASLKPNGVFILDHLGKELLAARFQPTRADNLADGSILVQRTSITDDWSRVDSQWIMVSETSTAKFRLRHWLYSGQELRALLDDAGFADVKLYGSLDQTPYDPQAQRLIAVARK